MFIDDLIKYAFAYKSYPQVAKFLAKKNAILGEINQKIYFRDLVARAPEMTYGEAKKYTSVYTQEAVERLCAHVTSLVCLANEDHRANYCELSQSGNFKIKPGKENHITRIVTNEFSLYTQKPLTVTEFNRIYHEVASLNIEPNVHVLLSSFSVKEQDKILNISLYVEGGVPVKIHTFCKNTASKIDIDYGAQEQLFTQQKVGGTSHCANLIVSPDGYAVSSGSVFEVQTQGRAIYTQAIDVCLDHAMEHSKRTIIKRLLNEMAEDEIFPEQIEQCVTSNCINLQTAAIIADKVLHVDPRYAMHENYNAKLGDKILSEKAKKRSIPQGYEHMAVVENKNGYQVKNPPFGPSYVIDVLAERPAANYSPKYRKALAKHNEKVLENMALISQQTPIAEKAKLLFFGKKTNDPVLSHLTSLQTDLNKMCRPSLWQRLFKTMQYQQKVEAKRVIATNFDFIQSAMRSDCTALALIRPWKKYLESQFNSLGATFQANSFKSQLSQALNKSINEDLSKKLGCEFEQSASESQLYNNPP